MVTIRKIEQGDRRPSKQLAELMAAALQVPAEQVADFVTYARQDPDSTLDAACLAGLRTRPSLCVLLTPGRSRSIVPSLRQTPRIVTLPRPTTPFLGREAEIDGAA